MNSCSLLFVGFFALQTALMDVNLHPRESMLGQSKLAPRAEDLNIPTEIGRLSHWLKRLFPQTCTSTSCRRLIKKEVWIGKLQGTQRLCQALLFYGTGDNMQSTFDILLQFEGLKANDGIINYRSTIFYGGAPEGPMFLPNLNPREWGERLGFLDSLVEVTATHVRLRSRPMLEGMSDKTFLGAGLHELQIEFSPMENPVLLTGTEVSSGKTMTCLFTDDS